MKIICFNILLKGTPPVLHINFSSLVNRSISQSIVRCILWQWKELSKDQKSYSDNVVRGI